MKLRPRPAIRCPGATTAARAASGPRSGRGSGLALWLALATAAACRPETATTPPAAAPEPVAWAEGDVLQARPISGPAPAAASPATRVARLDALLDLLDAARFADDADARERLWIGLGGTARARGPEATRDAATRLLAEAIQLDAGPGLDADAHDFVAGVIALLSADLGLVGAAEDLAIRTAAYRDVAEHGHPRAADNARWRLYDHVRGCLVGAVSAPQERRVEIAVHSLYVREDSLAAWLDDGAVHAQRPPPAPEALQTLLVEARTAATADPRWAAVAARRVAADATLEATVRSALPAARDPSWPLAALPQGTARRDSLAPIVRIDDRTLTIDLGHPEARAGERGAPELVKALEGALARDGRGAVLLVAPPMLPSPALNSVARTLLDARVARVELAVREPRVPQGSGDVIVQLPLEVVRDTDQGPAAIALRKARLHVQLDGRGARAAVDGRWLERRSDPTAVATLLGDLRRAYPREHMITVGLGDDVLYQQLIDLVRALIGGPERRFDVAAWRPTAAAAPEAPPAKAVAAEERRLQRRAELAAYTARAGLDQSFPLAAGDQQRLEQLARQLLRCLPELETPLPVGERVRLTLRFEEGRLAQLTARKPATRVPAERLAALQTCAEAEARGFRLREHRDVVTADVLLAAR